MRMWGRHHMSYSVALYLIFWVRVSCSTGSSLVLLYWLARKSQGSSCLLPSARIKHMSPCLLLFKCGFWGLNLGPHAYRASALVIQPCPQLICNMHLLGQQLGLSIEQYLSRDSMRVWEALLDIIVPSLIWLKSLLFWADCNDKTSCLGYIFSQWLENILSHLWVSSVKINEGGILNVSTSRFF